MSKTWKLVAFDCDGVLVDSRQVVDDLLKPFFRERELSYNRNEMFAVDPLKYLQERHVDPIKLMTDLAGIYAQAPIRWDVINAIKSLQHQRPTTKIVVITSNTTQIVRQRLANEKIDSLFDNIIGHDVIDFPGVEIPQELKTRKAQQIFFLLQLWGISHEDCCFFGDTTSDLHSATEVNVHRFAITGGFQDDEYLRRHSKNVICCSSELLETLGLENGV